MWFLINRSSDSVCLAFLMQWIWQTDAAFVMYVFDHLYDIDSAACCARGPRKWHDYHTDSVPAHTNICLHLELMDILWFNSLCSCFPLPEKHFCPAQSLWIPTAAWITKAAMWVMNQLKSHHMEQLWVTPSSPSDPNLGLWASPNEVFICYSEIRMRHVAGIEVLWRIAVHANVVLHSLSPRNQQFCSKLICIQYSRILPMCTAWKAQISQQPYLMLMKLFGTQFKVKLDTCCISFLDFREENMLFFNGQGFDVADV